MLLLFLQLNNNNKLILLGRIRHYSYSKILFKFHVQLNVKMFTSGKYISERKKFEMKLWHRFLLR